MPICRRVSDPNTPWFKDEMDETIQVYCPLRAEDRFGSNISNGFKVLARKLRDLEEQK